MARKVFLKKINDRIISFAFTRPSESGRARKVNEYQGKLEKLTRSLRNLQLRRKEYVSKIDSKIEATEEEIEECKDHLVVLHSEEFQQWINEQRQDEVEAYANAEHFMKEHLGLDAYAQLMEKGELIFEAEEKTFKITRYGLFYERQENGEFRPRCVVRPRELPLPDYVVSVLETIKHEPKRILGEVR